MSRSRHAGLGACLVVVLAILGGSCREGLDVSDPEAVARAFYDAAADQRFDEAAEHVLPAQRDDFLVAMKREPPTLTKGAELEVSIRGDRADVDLPGSADGFDMRREGGRWWIVK